MSNFKAGAKLAKQHAAVFAPLASLTPETDSNSSIKATVTLLWPYSPSTLTFRLLVSEEDSRLRRNRGQLRLDFRGTCARVLSTKNLQIGDRIVLSLKGAEFRPLKSATQKDVPWIIKFQKKAKLKLRNEDNWVLIDEPELHPEASSTIPSPAISETTRDTQHEWSTSAAFKRHRPSPAGSKDTYFGSLFDEEDLELENPPKRPRFPRSFRMISRSPPAIVRAIETRSEEKDESQQSPKDDTEQTAHNRREREGAGQLSEGSEEELKGFIEQDVPMVDAHLPTVAPSEASNKFIVKLRKHLSGGPVVDVAAKIVTEMEARLNTMPAENGTQDSLKQCKINEYHHTMKICTEMLDGGDYEGSMRLLGRLKAKGKSYDTLGQAPGNKIAVGAIDQTINLKDQYKENVMSPSELPNLRIPTAGDNDEMPDSPNLRPVPSPSLPIVSPLPNRGLSSPDHPVAGDVPTSGETMVLDKSLDCIPLDLGTASLAIENTRPSTEEISNASLPSAQQSAAEVTVNKEAKAAGPTQLQAAAVPDPLSANADDHDAGTGDDTHMSHSNTSPRTVAQRKSIRHEREQTSLTYVEGQKESKSGGEGQANELENSSSLLESVRRKFATVSNNLLRRAQIGRGPKALPEQSQTGSAISQPVSALVKLEAGIITNLSDFQPLSKLRLGVKADIIGVIARTKPITRAARGPRDYFTSIRVVDYSKPIGLTVTIFRPREEAVIKAEAGDCVLLRDIKILTQRHQLVGLSADTSAWAVWKWAKERNGLQSPAIICGPPVEFGPQEESYAEALGQWYWSLEEEARANLLIWNEEERPK